MSSSTPPHYAHGVMEYLLNCDAPSPITPQPCKYTPTARKQIPVGSVYKVFNTYYRNVIKFHIGGHIGDETAVPADAENAESLAMTGKAAGTSFEGILYEQWSEYLTKLQEMKKSLSGYELVPVRVNLKGRKLSQWEEMETRMQTEKDLRRENRKTRNDCGRKVGKIFVDWSALP
ncbi:uncharacterized protein EAE97_000536 [Botrytis byssoidea]|uniref:Uncharacterized protein n=1 Tax=Botrytis byssoidea TaxID=139641 RepID=A0A9P5IVJ8_9HELO|nr:uncharacterized protein EAE97_000536 [Botrytis byssoidea]KAF7955277.1 hypothetical protein EAE97_000536 [Botrytis byssoidea]